ncbi:CBS domain-containing protein, partial [Novosphingobium sp.]|uniref:CBS domain-containing protein n=1 Tax=Novosphingobium sp. TaxID=1874826 RepID=UPI0028AF64C5
MVNDLLAGVSAGARPAKRGLYIADIVEMLQALTPEAAAAKLGRMADVRAVAVLDRPEFTTAPEVLPLLPLPRAVHLVAQMAEDRAADVLAEMDDGVAAQILGALAPEVRTSLRSLLAWPEDSAGGMMTTEFVAARVSATVAEVLDLIRTVERSRETVYSVFLLDERGRLDATISLRRLIAAAPDSPAIDLARDREPVTVTPATDREAVADLIRRHDLLALPVVDDAGRPLGIVTVDDVLDVNDTENTE